MNMTYQGTVRELTGDLQTIISDLRANRDPQGQSLESGRLIVQFINRSDEISGGEFRVVAPDDPDIIGGYRFQLLAALTNPCAAEQRELRALEKQLRIARADNAVSEIERLEREVARAGREFDRCELQNGTTDVNFFEPQLVFRSTDLFRSGTSDTTINNLRIFFRILTQADVEFIRQAAPQSTTILTNEDLMQRANAEINDSSIEVTRVFTDGGKLQLNFSIDITNATVTGNVRLTVEPSRNHDFKRIIEVDLSDFDLDGIIPEIIERLARERIELRLEPAVRRLEASINREFESNLNVLTSFGATVTLINVAKERDGLHLSVAIGILRGMIADPCQSIRDQIQFLERELRAAQLENLPDRVESLRGEIAQNIRALTSCRQSQQGDDPVPQLRLSGNSVSFGSVPVNDTRTRTLTIESISNADVRVSFPDSGGGAIQWRGFDGTIPGNEKKVIVFEFRPSAKETVEKQLRISSNASGSPHIITVRGRGVGGSPF